MIEFAVLIIRFEQAVERQQRREQRRDPDDARADALHERGFGTNAKRKQDHSENEEPQDETSIAPLAHSEVQIAPEEADERRHAQHTAKPGDGVNASSVIVVASAISIA